MTWRAIKAAVGLSVCFLPGATCLHAQADLRVAENEQFEIVGFDARSVRYVEELSRYVVESAQRYFAPSGFLFPQRILVSLKPEAYVEFDGGYEIRVADPGLVSLDLRWEEGMSLNAASRALAEALMVRYAIFNYGSDGSEFLPEWLGSAIGTEVYFRLRPAQSENLVKWIDFEEPGSLEELLKRGWDEPVSDANGYALLLSMRRSGVTPSELRALFARASAGFDISEALKTLIQPELPTDEPVTLEAWWQGSLDAITESADGVLESMEVSREWISALSDFSTITEGDLNFRTIWVQRDVEEVRVMIEARYELVRLRLIRVNPAYYNAAISLGGLFESLLNDDRQFEYLHSLTAFLSDFEDTKQLQAAVEEKLSSMPQ